MAVPQEVLTSYLPGVFLERVREGHWPLGVAERLPLTGAVLFADLSGFTALTERMASRGRGGVEALTEHLNAFFGPLISSVLASGGDVVKFAGDALLAFWSAETLPLAEATRRAAACAWHAQAELQWLEPEPGVRLSMRAALGAGQAAFSQLGGLDGRWELFFAGEALRQAADITRMARPGEVVVSLPAWALLQGSAQGRPLTPLTLGGPVAVRLEGWQTAAEPPGEWSAPQVDAALLWPYLPEAIVPRLQAGQLSWLGELRRISVLFLHLPDLEFLADSSVAVASGLVQRAQGILRGLEGAVNKLSVDEKGPGLLAVFGLPGRTHEDDPVRAVRAALALAEAAREARVRAAVGVTTGRAFCGTVGSAQRCEYSVMGGPVNLAARLMMAAGEGVLCDRATWSAIGGSVVWGPKSTMALKGLGESVEVVRPMRVVEGGTRPRAARSGMVDRRAEREQLRQALEELCAGQTQALLIQGEAGVGKSCLVEELRTRALEAGVRVLSGGANVFERSSPLHGWRSVLGELLELDGDRSVEERRARVRQAMGDSGPYARLMPLLNPVFGLELSEDPLLQQMSLEARADGLQDLCAELLQRAAAQGPLLVILEDAHWLDSASWRLVLPVLSRVKPLLLALVARPMRENPPRELQELLERPSTRALPLDVLSLEDAQALICARLGVTSLPQEIAELIHRKAEGHPFFSEELAFALRDAGLLRIEGERCSLGSGAGALQSLDLPDTVEGVITTRIDRLSPSEQLTLKVASVLGRIFAFQTLREIFPIASEREALGDYLHHLGQLDVTSINTPEPALTYIFNHVITRDVAYNLMAFSQRRALHRLAAEWYERTQAENLAPYYSLLAHHWSLGDVPEKTLDYLEKAGAQALRAGAFGEAATFFAEALPWEARARAEGAAWDSLRRVRLLRQLSHARLSLGQHSEARDASQQVMALSGRPVPPTAWRVVLALGWQLLRLLLAWSDFFRQGKTLPPPSPLLLEQAKAAWCLAEACVYQGRPAELIWLSCAMTADLLRVSPCTELTHFVTSLSYVSMMLGWASGVERFNARALSVVSTSDLPAGRGAVLLVVGVTQFNLCQWEASDRALEEAALRFRQLNEWRNLKSALIFRAAGRLFRGEPTRARASLEELLEEADRRGDVEARLWCWFWRAEIHLLQERLGLALDDLEAGLEQLAGSGADRKAEAVMILGQLARARYLAGDHARSLEALKRFAPLLDRLRPTNIGVLVGLNRAVEAALALWREGADSAGLALAKGVATRGNRLVLPLARSFVSIAADAWRLHGQLRFLMGVPKASRKALKRSLELARRHQLPLSEGQVLVEQGLVALGGQRRVLLEQAVACFERAEAPFLAVRTRQLLGGEPSSGAGEGRT